MPTISVSRKYDLRQGLSREMKEKPVPKRHIVAHLKPEYAVSNERYTKAHERFVRGLRGIEAGEFICGGGNQVLIIASWLQQGNGLTSFNVIDHSLGQLENFMIWARRFNDGIRKGGKEVTRPFFQMPFPRTPLWYVSSPVPQFRTDAKFHLHHTDILDYLGSLKGNKKRFVYLSNILSYLLMEPRSEALVKYIANSESFSVGSVVMATEPYRRLPGEGPQEKPYSLILTKKADGFIPTVFTWGDHKLEDTHNLLRKAIASSLQPRYRELLRQRVSTSQPSFVTSTSASACATTPVS